MLNFSDYYLNQKMDFQNIPYNIYINNKDKIKLTKNNISLQFYFAGSNQLGYKLSFIVRIVTPQNNPSIYQLRDSDIDQNSLRQAIIDNIDEEDRKYVVLKNFSSNKAEFYFNYDKWIIDAFKDVSLEKQFSFFDRSITLKVPVPKMIMSDSLRSDFVAFMTKKIKDYIVKNGLSKKWFIKIVPKMVQDAMDIRTEDLFTYSYDIQYNKFTINLKPEFVIAISYIISANIKKGDKVDSSISDPKYFDIAVNQNLKKYVKTDWKKLIKTKLI